MEIAIISAGIGFLIGYVAGSAQTSSVYKARMQRMHACIDSLISECVKIGRENENRNR